MSNQATAVQFVTDINGAKLHYEQDGRHVRASVKVPDGFGAGVITVVGDGFIAAVAKRPGVDPQRTINALLRQMPAPVK